MNTFIYVVDKNIGNDGLNTSERDLLRQYEANVKDPNGKQLLLLLDALIRELHYRKSMKMLSIELNSFDIERCHQLLVSVEDLISNAARKASVKSRSITARIVDHITSHPEKKMQEREEATPSIVANTNTSDSDNV